MKTKPQPEERCQTNPPRPPSNSHYVSIVSPTTYLINRISTLSDRRHIFLRTVRRTWIGHGMALVTVRVPFGFDLYQSPRNIGQCSVRYKIVFAGRKSRHMQRASTTTNRPILPPQKIPVMWLGYVRTFQCRAAQCSSHTPSQNACPHVPLECPFHRS